MVHKGMKTLYTISLILLICMVSVSHAEESPVPISESGFIRFCDLTNTSGEELAPYYVGTVSKEVLFAPPASETLILPANEEGQVQLNLQQLAPALDPSDVGWRIRMQYQDKSGYLPTQSRVGYQYVDRNEDIPIPLVLTPPGVPTQGAKITIRPVRNLEQQWQSPAITIPEGAHLDLNLGLDLRWPAQRGGAIDFEVAWIAEEARTVLLQDTLIVGVRGQAAWVPHRIALEEYAGKTGVFEFSTKSNAEAQPEPFVYPLWGSPVLQGSAPASTWSRPNIILVSLDTLRADRLGLYGYDKDTSPNLDAFAEECVVFEQAITSSCWTSPSHTSLFTGVSPSVHRAGVWSSGFQWSREWTTLAEIARAQGYRTAAFTEGVAVRGEDGFNQGFETYSDSNMPQAHDVGKIERTLRKTKNWLKDNGDLPYFLFLHTYEVHAPYGGPRSWAVHYLDPGFEGPVPRVPTQEHTPERTALLSKVYDGGVRYMDHVFGEFLNDLKVSGQLENSVVIILSDHGEDLGEHGYHGHLRYLYDDTIHVPLLIRFPDAMQKTGRVPQMVGMMDVFATILSLWQMEVPHWVESESLLPLIQEETRDQYSRKHLVSTLIQMAPGLSQKAGRLIEWSLQSVRSNDWKYLRTNRGWHFENVGNLEAGSAPEEQEFLYDLKTDPDEMVSVVESNPDQSKLLSDVLELYRKHAYNRREKKLNQSKDFSVEEISEETLKGLEAMGYL